MAKELKKQVVLAFTADTEQAKKQLRDLKGQLDYLIQGKGLSSKSLGLTQEIQNATNDTIKLKNALIEATNTSTGKLDLTKFSHSLREADLSIDQIKNSLLELGPSGAQTFTNLATSITQAEAPLVRMNSKIREIGTSLANTARWQLSSSILHGFMGAIQGAYGYAQDLNESLNNIRIVTNQSTEQMAKFAVQANKTAKQLSSTTTQYTDASLIYYQQGLDDEAVQKRAEITLKLANVTGQSAQTVSDQLTSVWNNFAEGSDNLEHYVDVMTKLGATTASSSDEIATGLEKFSAIANTVGLSYEYAASALATVTAETRQSADTVGTAFKTLFSRLEGLQLGETADDGTTLNKYSKALMAVGVNIKDQTGQLKDMDAILDELGTKWQTIDKNTQVALAQTVGGVRQYATLISLMDNWDKFQENLSTAYNADGALQEQANTYAESWDAALKRVKAAWEDIYMDLIDDEFAINLTDTFASVLTSVNEVIKNLGGLKGLLGTIFSLIVSKFGPTIATSINFATKSMREFISTGKTATQRLREDTIVALRELYQTSNQGSRGEGFVNNLFTMQANAQELLLRNNDKLTESQKRFFQAKLDTLNLEVKETLEQKKQLELLEQQKNQIMGGTYDRLMAANSNGSIPQDQWTQLVRESMMEGGEMSNNIVGQQYLSNLITQLDGLGEKSDEVKRRFLSIGEAVANGSIVNDTGKFGEELQRVFQDVNNDTSIEQIREKIGQLRQFLQDNSISDTDAMRVLGQSYDMLPPKVQALIDNLRQQGNALAELGIKATNTTAIFGNFADEIDEAAAKNQSTLGSFFSLSSGLGQVASSIRSLKGLIDTWNNDDLSTFEKLLTTFTTLGFALPMLYKGLVEVVGVLRSSFGPKAVLIAAILTALVISFKKIYEWLNKDKIAFEKLTKATDKAKKSAEQTKKEYDKLTGSVEKLAKQEEAIEKMDRATKKWRDSVSSLNQETANLLEYYGLLKPGNYYYDSDGIMHVYPEVWAQQEAELAAAEAEQNRIQSTGNLSKAYSQNNNEYKEASDNFYNETNYYTYYTSENAAEGGNILTEDDMYEIMKYMFDNYLKNDNGVATTSSDGWNKENFAEAVAATQGLTQDQAAQIAESVVSATDKDSSDYNPEVDDAFSQLVTEFNSANSSESANSINANSENILREAYGNEISGLNAGQQRLFSDMAGDLLKPAYEQAVEAVNSEEISEEDRERAYQAYQYKKDINGDYVKTVDGETKKAEDEIDDEDVKLVKTSDKIKEYLPDSEEIINAVQEQWSNLSEEEKSEKKEEAFDTRKNSLLYSSEMDEPAFEKYIDKLSEDLPEVNELYDENSELALDAAESAMKWTSAADSLTEVINDNEDALSGAEGAEAYSKALSTVAEKMQSVLGSEVTSEFVEENMPKIKEMLNGSTDALRELQKEAAVTAVDLDPKVEGLEEEEKEKLKNEIASVFDTLDASESLVFSPKIDEEAFNALSEQLLTIAEMFGMTAEQASKYFAEALNLKVPLKTKKVTFYGDSETTYVAGNVVQDDEGNSHTLTAEQAVQMSSQGYIEIPFLDYEEGENIEWRGSTANKGSTSLDSNKKKAKKSSKEVKRYELITEQLADINRELERISKAKARAFGADKLKLIDKEIAKTKELISAEQEYTKQLENNYASDKEAMRAYGAEFDNNGNILNYEDLINKQVNAYNASMSEEAEEAYDNFTDALEQYKETNELLHEQREKMIDLEYELADLLLERIEYTVKLKVDVSEDTIKYINFLMDLSGDSFDETADKISRLSSVIGENIEKIDAWKEGLDAIFKDKGYKGSVAADLLTGKITAEDLAKKYNLTEAEIELIREYANNIMDTTVEVNNLRKEITDSLIAGLEDMNDQFDKQIDKIDRAGKLMDGYRDIIELVGEDVLGVSNEMNELFNEAKMNNAISKVSAAKTKLNANEARLAELKAEKERLIAKEGSEEAIAELDRAIETVEEMILDSTDELLEAEKTALEQAKKNFEDSLKAMTDAFEKAMSGIYGNLEKLQAAYERQSEINERYVQDYERIYELSKLSRDIGNSIDATDNIRAKQELIELQEEINALEESGVEMSKYDLDFLRQKYELRLAEIALEEAQNAKSQVRMTRDSEGNWNYTYTANEENISKAEQSYEDALLKTQKLTTDYIKDLENRIFQLNTDLVNALSEIDPNDTEGRQRIMDYYNGQMGYLSSQLQSAFGNNADIYNNDWTNYSNATGYKISENEKWIDSFNETTLSLLTGYETLSDYQNAFFESSTQMYKGISAVAGTYANDVKEVLDAAGNSVDEFAKKAESAYKDSENGFITLTDQATESIEDLSETAKTEFDKILDNLKIFNDDYGTEIEKTIDDNKKLADSYLDIIEAKSKLEESNNSNNKKQNQNNTSNQNNRGSSNGGGDGVLNVGDSVTFNGGNYYSSSNGGTSGSRGPGKKVTVTQIKDGALYPIHVTSSDSAYGWLTKGQLSGYDTGGYTGAWGTTAGKLAMLHEKELVLNKQDTENILQSVNLVRQISDWISGRVNAMQYGNMLSAFGLPGDNKNVLEQVVTIHAEFPNANNRAEIEAAFDNLVNRAAQYAYRK